MPIEKATEVACQIFRKGGDSECRETPVEWYRVNVKSWAFANGGIYLYSRDRSGSERRVDEIVFTSDFAERFWGAKNDAHPQSFAIRFVSERKLGKLEESDGHYGQPVWSLRVSDDALLEFGSNKYVTLKTVSPEPNRGQDAAAAPLAPSPPPLRDPKAVLRVTNVETYWVVDPSSTNKHFLAPVIRLRVENTSHEVLQGVDATAGFFREGVDGEWGSGFQKLTTSGSALAPGASVELTLKSDARYTIAGEPGDIFTNAMFKPVDARYFLRVGGSPWVEFGREIVANAIGSP